MGKRIRLATFLLALLAGIAGVSRAIDQAMPGDHPVNPHGQMNEPQPPGDQADDVFLGDRSAFEKEIQLDQFRLLAVQHLDQMKIVDSWARQCLEKIRNRQTIDGKDPVFTALDIGLRPEVWNDRNIIYIQAVPIREQVARFAEGSTPEAVREESERIVREGLVSPRFLDHPEVQQQLQQMALDTRQAQAVGRIYIAQDTLNSLFFRLYLAPPGADNRMGRWYQPIELVANTLTAEQRKAQNLSLISGYTADQSLRIRLAVSQLMSGWRAGDATLANQGIKTLAEMLPTIDPGGYPSEAKRVTELWYNRTFYGTVANVFLYFLAMTLFLLVAVGVSEKLRPYAYTIFTVAVALHLVSMGVRMWLAGRWPTQNEFESVLGAALLGCVVGWVLETWKKNGLFGMAFSFVGFLAMTACMAAPYMFGNDLGGAISKTAGILQTYWLYIHVNIVISSYALISATFILGAVYLLIRLWYWINPLEMGEEGETGGQGDRGTEGASLEIGGVAAGMRLSGAAVKQIEAERAAMLATLDQANMVILQMAFWFLGIGIVCGAVWADHSWGRPWGWDPKETFALVTWIVYLIIVHLRLVVPKVKADVTAWMSIAGFGIMLFNWIGVNYFLAGLHSYA